jgi:hypothetical protein
MAMDGFSNLACKNGSAYASFNRPLWTLSDRFRPEIALYRIAAKRIRASVTPWAAWAVVGERPWLDFG